MNPLQAPLAAATGDIMAAKQKSLVVVTGLRLLMSFCFSLIISPVSFLMGLAMGSIYDYTPSLAAIDVGLQ